MKCWINKITKCRSSIDIYKNNIICIHIKSTNGGKNEGYSVSYGYDKNTNINYIKRNGRTDLSSGEAYYRTIENDSIILNGNQLVSVDDAATSPDINDSFDYKDGADASVEYLYDANGNMVQDKNKGIAQIQYNHLNMLTRITYDNGNMIDYLYSASGAKLKVTHTTNKLLMVNTNIGTGTSGTTIKTKINRLTIDEPSLVRRASTSTTTTSELEILRELRACLARSAGEQVEPLGESPDRTYGLDLYDVEARQYDAIAPWFTCIDPLAEKYYSISPYAYCAGDPVNCVDPDGRDIFVLSAPNGAHGAGHMARLWVIMSVKLHMKKAQISFIKE